VLNSLLKARSVIRRFKPDVAIGVGGYASGPLLHQAASAGIPCVIQEQNSYPGITNKLLAKKAEKICVAYPNMDRFFPKEKLVLTGNPVRDLIKNTSAKRAEALKTFDLDSKLKTVLVIGGSLGARTINESIKSFLQHNTTPIQLIWQTGKAFFQQAQNEAQQATVTKALVFDFIERMDLAYGAADVIISRAGALSVSELCVVGKPAILIPSPNVSEDHQTKNAMALVEKKAAVLVTDSNARSELANALLNLLNNDTIQLQLATNISKLALPDADDTIAAEILKTCTTKPAHS
jgi:UDP-N-acetylglucosamine--N-acetylmuramyl-(pentapeptide) pyrophosphoryl-undecaprenol N-acetylglucosamine transferase